MKQAAVSPTRKIKEPNSERPATRGRRNDAGPKPVTPARTIDEIRDEWNLPDQMPEEFENWLRSYADAEARLEKAEDAAASAVHSVKTIKNEMSIMRAWFQAQG